MNIQTGRFKYFHVTLSNPHKFLILNRNLHLIRFPKTSFPENFEKVYSDQIRKEDYKWLNIRFFHETAAVINNSNRLPHQRLSAHSRTSRGKTRIYNSVFPFNWIETCFIAYFDRTPRWSCKIDKFIDFCLNWRSIVFRFQMLRIST